MYTHIIFKALRAVRRARCPNLQFSVRVPNEFTFRSTCGVIFCTLGFVCEVISGPRGHFGGAVGSFFVSKNGLGTTGAPRAAQEAPPPFRPQPFGDLVELSVHFLSFVCKKHFWNMSLFFFDFWVALSVPKDRLICNPYTPAQSKHTFPFSHLF